MRSKNKCGLKDYKKAFIKFSGLEESSFQIKKDSGALVLYEGMTYRVCHYDDLLEEFKTYFKNDYTLIYTETPFDLWAILFERHHEITDDDLIIDIFNAWSDYWKHEKVQFVNKHTYENAKARSREEFNQLVDQLQKAPGNFITNAIEISDITLIPVIALSLRSRFKIEENFYKECVDILIEEFPDLFASDGNFDLVEIETIDSDAEPFYIYKPDYDYGD
ncbi:hypothetical protein [Pedobacter westerhofensis]|nr:hypothetical protein [Pedobacter westerhofensis]